MRQSEAPTSVISFVIFLFFFFLFNNTGYQYCKRQEHPKNLRIEFALVIYFFLITAMNQVNPPHHHKYQLLVD